METKKLLTIEMVVVFLKKFCEWSGTDSQFNISKTHLDTLKQFCQTHLETIRTAAAVLKKDGFEAALRCVLGVRFLDPKVVVLMQAQDFDGLNSLFTDLTRAMRVILNAENVYSENWPRTEIWNAFNFQGNLEKREKKEQEAREKEKKARLAAAVKKANELMKEQEKTRKAEERESKANATKAEEEKVKAAKEVARQLRKECQSTFDITMKRLYWLRSKVDPFDLSETYQVMLESLQNAARLSIALAATAPVEEKEVEEPEVVAQSA